MTLLAELLVFVSSGLLIPCIAFLLILFYQSIAMMTQTLIYFRRHHDFLDAFAEWIHGDAKTGPPESRSVNEFYGCIRKLIDTSSKAQAMHIVSEYEASCERQLSKTSRLAKLGPVIGLIGTLIPMGPALDGLAQGDIVQLAEQMQVAFTTTVVGLVIGGLGFVLVQFDRHLISRQLAALDYLCDSVSEQLK